MTGDNTSPLPPELSVREARDYYLAENGFSLDSYDEPWTPASILGIPVSVPNPPRHRWAIMLHDLHHVATGFGTDLAGEAEISAWEFRAGLQPVDLYTSTIILSLVALGLLVAPRRMMLAWQANIPRQSLFHVTAYSYEDLLVLSVGELRQLLGIPVLGLVKSPRWKK